MCTANASRKSQYDTTPTRYYYSVLYYYFTYRKRLAQIAGVCPRQRACCCERQPLSPVYICMCMYVCVCVCMYVYVCNTYVCVFVCVYVCVYTYMLICMYTCMLRPN